MLKFFCVNKEFLKESIFNSISTVNDEVKNNRKCNNLVMKVDPFSIQAQISMWKFYFSRCICSETYNEWECKGKNYLRLFEMLQTYLLKSMSEMRALPFLQKAFKEKQNKATKKCVERNGNVMEREEVVCALFSFGLYKPETLKINRNVKTRSGVGFFIFYSLLSPIRQKRERCWYFFALLFICLFGT